MRRTVTAHRFRAEIEGRKRHDRQLCCTAATIFFAVIKKALYGDFIRAIGLCGKACNDKEKDHGWRERKKWRGVTDERNIRSGSGL
jgi:hypothetical protein